MSNHPPALVIRPWFVPACVLVFTLALCAATLSPASNFDGYMVWRFCQRILQGVPYDESIWDHRTARFGVVVPALGVQAVFGTSINAYYLLTSLTTATAATATFLLGRTVANTWVGVLAAFSLVLTPMVCWFSDCQLTAELFSMTFVPLCLRSGYLACKHGMRRDVWACALWFGASYFAKETNVFFGPAVVWLLFKHAPRRWTTLGVFCLTNIALFAVETALYRAFTAQRLGRISVILGNHLNNRAPIEEALPSFWHLLRRFTELRLDMALPLYVFFAATIWLWAIRKTTPPAARPSSLTGLHWVTTPALCFLVITTFGVRSLDPIKVFQPFRDRYLLPCFGLAWLTIWAVVDFRGWLELPQRWFRENAKRGIYLLTAAAFLVVSMTHVGLRLMKRHAPTEERAFHHLVENALRSRTPMIAPPGDRKTILYVQSFLWDEYQPRDWLVATLPNLRQVMLPTEQVPSTPPSDQAAEALLRQFIGKPVLRTEYSYVYRAKPDVVSERDFELGKTVVDRD